MERAPDFLIITEVTTRLLSGKLVKVWKSKKFLENQENELSGKSLDLLALISNMKMSIVSHYSTILQIFRFPKFQCIDCHVIYNTYF